MMRMWLAACLYVVANLALAADTVDTAEPAAAQVAAVAPAKVAQMETELQALNWEQFKFVVQSLPKLKADVDAYGPLGWEYVRQNYKTYAWKRSIAKLDDTQKQQLRDLIDQAKSGR